MKQTGSASESAMAESRYVRIRGLLERYRQRIIEEIGNYPQPIAGCDEQFSHLLEQQTAIHEELCRLQENGELRCSMSRLNEFVRSSRFVDEA